MSQNPKNYILEVKHPRGEDFYSKCTFAKSGKAFLLIIRGINEKEVKNKYILEPEKYLKYCEICGVALIRITSVRLSSAY